MPDVDRRLSRDNLILDLRLAANRTLAGLTIQELQSDSRVPRSTAIVWVMVAAGVMWVAVRVARQAGVVGFTERSGAAAYLVETEAGGRTNEVRLDMRSP
jgi:hypothetical protein